MDTNWLTVYLHLGYIKVPGTELRPYPTGTPIEQICLDLSTLDETLRNAATDSMAVQVGELRVDYVRHMYILKVEGNRKLRQLSSLTGIPLVFDKYFGRGVSDPRVNPVSVKSIW